MLRSALIMILLAIGALASAAETSAMPRLSTTFTDQDDRVVQINDKRIHGHRSFDRGRGAHRRAPIHRGHKWRKAFAKHHGYRYQRNVHHDTFIARRIGKGQFVIIRPVRSYRPPRPLITYGRLLRNPY